MLNDYGVPQRALQFKSYARIAPTDLTMDTEVVLRAASTLRAQIDESELLLKNQTLSRMEAVQRALLFKRAT